MPIVHTFKDISGKTKHVVKIDSEYYIKDNHRAQPAKSIEQAVENENNRVLIRYARKYNSTVGIVKSELENDASFLEKERRRGKRFAMPDEEGDSLDMSSSVGKKRQEYKASFKERIFTAADSVYIDTVDEYYGAEKYLRKIGKKKNAASILQAIRASMSAAQVMIGDVQKDIFSEDGKTLGEGLSKIVKPITVKGDTIKRTFNEYLMHHLNVDRMSLEEKSLAQLEEMKAKLKGDVQKVRKLNEKIAELKDKKKSIFSDEEAQKQLDQRIAKYQKEAKALKKDILEQKKQIDNFEVMKNKPIKCSQQEKCFLC